MFASTLLLGAFSALVAAQSSVLTFTHVPNPLTDGEAQAITYATNDTSSPATIILRQGESSNLKTIMTLTTDATGGQYVWTPPKSLPDGSDYALEITQGNQVNYFGPFEIQGASASASSSSSSSASNSNSSSTATGAIGGATGGSSSNSTMTSTGGNSTMTATGKNNSTMTSATTTRPHTAGHGSMTGTASMSGSGAPFQGSTATGGGAGATSTGAASSDFLNSNPYGLALGAMAAAFYLH